MSTSVNVVILVGLGFACFFLIRKIFRGQKKTILHAPPKDPKSQALYEQKKYHKDEQQSLSLKEKIELSWKFLTKIANHIKTKFSEQDKKKIQEIGEILLRNGCKYQHNIDKEVKIMLSVSVGIQQVKSMTR